MASKRVKSDKLPLVSVAHWTHADELIKRIADLQFQITAAEQKAADDINEAKGKLIEVITPLQAETRQLVDSLEVFAAAHTAVRSKKLNFGLLGWRKSPSVVIKKTTLEKIKETFTKAKAAMCIITKETVSKEALAKLTDEELASVGARREVKDDFFVEPDLPEAVDYID